MNFEFETILSPLAGESQSEGTHLAASPLSSPVEGEDMNDVTVANLPEDKGEAGLVKIIQRSKAVMNHG